MLENIFNLDGVTILDKKQQGNIKGGTACKFTVIGTENGQPARHVETYLSPVSGSGSSNWANDVCSHAVSTNSNVDRCFYDCDYDGFGQ